MAVVEELSSLKPVTDEKEEATADWAGLGARKAEAPERALSAMMLAAAIFMMSASRRLKLICDGSSWVQKEKKRKTKRAFPHIPTVTSI